MMGTNDTTRGMSTPLSHVLSVGITTILIVGLMTGASGFLDDQGERTARDELETIGNRLAGELDEADTLGRQADNVTLTSNHPDRVAGSTYTARLVTDPVACSDVPTQTCLRLSATEYDHESVLAVNNETDLRLREINSGTFRISSAGGSAMPQAPTRSLDLSSRVGIGSSVGAGPPIGVGGSLAQQPVARFHLRTPEPQTSKQVTLDAGGSQDPDGSIASYDWDFNDDGHWNVSGLTSPTTTTTYTEPGRKNVTLRVTDDDGNTNNYSDDFRVGGLEYEEDLRNTSGHQDSIAFTVTNQHTDPVDIYGLLINPEEPTTVIDSVSEDSSDAWCGSYGEHCTFPHEIQVSIGGSLESYIDWNTHSGNELTLVEPGNITQLDRDGDARGGNVTLQPGNTAKITVKHFNGPVINEDFELGVRYNMDGDYNGIRFNDTVTP